MTRIINFLFIIIILFNSSIIYADHKDMSETLKLNCKDSMITDDIIFVQYHQLGGSNNFYIASDQRVSCSLFNLKLRHMKASAKQVKKNEFCDNIDNIDFNVNPEFMKTLNYEESKLYCETGIIKNIFPNMETNRSREVEPFTEFYPEEYLHLIQTSKITGHIALPHRTTMSDKFKKSLELYEKPWRTSVSSVTGSKIYLPEYSPAITQDFLNPQVTSRDLLPSHMSQNLVDKHDGIDFFTEIGRPIIAPHDGIVIEAKTHECVGNQYIIKHDENLYSVIAHVGKFYFKPGDTVRRGDKIAESVRLNTECAGALEHIHFTLMKNYDHLYPDVLNPHDYWTGGVGKPECFEKNVKFPDGLITLPVQCYDGYKKSHWSIETFADYMNVRFSLGGELIEGTINYSDY